VTHGHAAVPRAFRGSVLHSPVQGVPELLHDALIVAGADGTITAVHAYGSADHAAAAAHFAASGELFSLAPGQYLLPGMVDLHVHAPQWPQLGTALDLPLEEWLQKYTFPLEARYADVSFAQSVYESLVDGLLANGTTCALYFGTLHLPATKKLADICLRRGQRALIGRVAMDDPGQCPDYYRDPSAQAAISETRAFIDYVRTLPGNAARPTAPALIQPVVTPRFIPSCSDDLLHGLGALAQEAGCHIQTHCSESDWAHRYVLDRCGLSDTRALERYGLLSRHTILAHGNFVDDDDLTALLEHGAGIAHCPLSNAYFSDAVLPVRHLLERGVNVGLGTDISGGSSPSIIENARQAVFASRCLESGVDPALNRKQRRREASRIDAPAAFWLATAGGGIALDLAIGIFKAGYLFDAIVVDTASGNSNLQLDPSDTAAVVLEKIVYHATRADIREVWVGNRRIRVS
jgi:guanine deaminase